MLYPPADEPSTNVNFNDVASYGPFYGVPQADYRTLLNFDQLQSGSSGASKSSSVDGNGVQGLDTNALQIAASSAVAGSGVLDSRRDVEIKFVGRINLAGSTHGFKLIVNGIERHEFTNFPRTAESQRSFIINRNHMNETGDNTIILQPNNPSLDWGLGIYLSNSYRLLLCR